MSSMPRSFYQLARSCDSFHHSWTQRFAFWYRGTWRAWCWGRRPPAGGLQWNTGDLFSGKFEKTTQMWIVLQVLFNGGTTKGEICLVFLYCLVGKNPKKVKFWEFVVLAICLKFVCLVYLRHVWYTEII